MAEVVVEAGADPEVIVDDGTDLIRVEGTGELVVTGTPVVTYIPEPYTPESDPWIVNGAVAMDHLRLKELAAPLSGPLVGYGRVFVKQSTGLPYFVDNSGLELPMYIPEPFTPRGSPWVVNGLMSSPGAGAGSERFGAGSAAAGAGASAFGPGATASGAGSVVVGNASVDALAANGIAIGESASVGLLAITGGIAIGAGSSSVNNDCVAIGEGSISGASSSLNKCTATGDKSKATNYLSSAYGQGANASGVSSTACGAISSANGSNSACLGRGSAASGANSVALGYQSGVRVSQTNGIALGALSEVTHYGGMALGRSAVSTAANRCTIGTIGGSYNKELQVGLGFAAWGSTPPPAQPSKISDPSGGTTIDAEARTAINSIIDVLEGAGLSVA